MLASNGDAANASGLRKQKTWSLGYMSGVLPDILHGTGEMLVQRLMKMDGASGDD